MITVYGVLKGQCIHTKSTDYQLNTINTFVNSYKGWFLIEKSDDTWLLWRSLFIDWTDSYINEDGEVVS